MTTSNAANQTYDLQTPLILVAPDGSPIPGQGNWVQLAKSGDRWADCQLEITVDWATYQRIDQEAWFHLQPGMRGAQSGGDFQPDMPVTLRLGLMPQKLELLTAIGMQPEPLVAHFRSWQQPLEEAPLQHSETWLAQAVVQHQDGRAVGFRTYWVYARAGLWGEAVQAGGTVMQDAANFFRSLTQQGWDAASQESFQLSSSVEQWLTNLATLDPQMGLSQNPLMQVAIAFFQADDWPYETVDDHTLTTRYRGQQGQWLAYVRIREQPPQFLFYSLYPEPVPPEWRSTMSEFITRANFGTFIGNFELDWDDGELRYKTSVDVLDNTINVQLVRRLVTLNVRMMDAYWLGIQAVITGERSPEAAIALVEES